MRSWAGRGGAGGVASGGVGISVLIWVAEPSTGVPTKVPRAGGLNEHSVLPCIDVGRILLFVQFINCASHL